MSKSLLATNFIGSESRGRMSENPGDGQMSPSSTTGFQSGSMASVPTWLRIQSAQLPASSFDFGYAVKLCQAFHKAGNCQSCPGILSPGDHCLCRRLLGEGSPEEALTEQGRLTWGSCHSLSSPSLAALLSWGSCVVGSERGRGSSLPALPQRGLHSRPVVPSQRLPLQL